MLPFSIRLYASARGPIPTNPQSVLQSGHPASLMTRIDKAILIGLLALFGLVACAVVLTHSWADYRNRPHPGIRRAAQPVDMHPLETAKQLAQQAVTHSEQDYAQQALRIGDHAVDLAFAAAIDEAAENPPTLTPETRDLVARIKSGQAAVAADQSRISQFTAVLARARGSARDDLQQLIGIAQAQLALDQDDLEEAQQRLISVGGDKQHTIQQLLDQHKASDTQSASMQVGAPAATTEIETTRAKTLVAEYRAWASLHAKQASLEQAGKDALTRASSLSNQRDTLQKQIDQGTLPTSPGSAEAAPGADPTLALLHRQTVAKKNVAQFGTRIETEKQLAAVYANWADLVDAHAKSYLHEMFVSALWIVLIILFVFAANYWLKRFLARIGRDRREMRTVHSVVSLSVQAVGLILILLVVLGMPSNFATVLALAGAGLTVALKDFIVGFLGWFVLMGKDGMRVGDWVEINGVGGEVLKIGPLHTVIMETGNWTDVGHPTGRKVSFVNSFAMEGHYFNFSTSGQWLWDEIEVLVPEGAEPHAIAEGVRKIAADETAKNAQLAEQEWNRVAQATSKSFSAAPSVDIRPTELGITVVVRYITRANERHETRVRLNRAIVELLQKTNAPGSSVAAATAKARSERA